MTKYKRIKARIERDKLRRDKKRIEQVRMFDYYDKMFTMQNYISALKKCNKNVGYKASTQEFNMNAIEFIHKIISSMENHVVPVPNSIHKVQIHERGKTRTITPIVYYDRITQRVICDNILVPSLARSLIYDNGASTKGKGVAFARKRIFRHLQRAVKTYGSDFYVLVFDFKSFFDSISHQVCYDILNKTFNDKAIVEAIMSIIHAYPIVDARQSIPDPLKRQLVIETIQNNQGVGICLGSQISQSMALTVPSKIDHLIKDIWAIKGYVRYMDDGVVIHHDKETLHKLLKSIIAVADSLHLKLNLKKTRIVKATKGFAFLKVRYVVSSSGKIIRKLTREGVVRMRRKLKRFKHLVDSGKMNVDDVFASVQSWLSHSKAAQSYQSRKRMLKLYDMLFGGYRLTRRYRHKQQTLVTQQRSTYHAILQTN